MDNASKPPEELPPVDWYRLFRSRIEHEDSLIIQRLSWLVASQAFLFSAYAITTNGLSNVLPKSASVFLAQATLLFQLIPLVAIFNALLIYISILAALRAIHELRRAYHAKALPPDLPPLQTSTTARRLGLAAPLLLPLLFMTVWSVLLFHGLH